MNNRPFRTAGSFLTQQGNNRMVQAQRTLRDSETLLQNQQKDNKNADDALAQAMAQLRG